MNVKRKIFNLLKGLLQRISLLRNNSVSGSFSSENYIPPSLKLQELAGHTAWVANPDEFKALMEQQKQKDFLYHLSLGQDCKPELIKRKWVDLGLPGKDVPA